MLQKLFDDSSVTSWQYALAFPSGAPMFVIVPFVVFLLLYLLCKRKSRACREAFLMAAIWWSTLATVIMEGLSAFDSFTALSVGVSWATVGVLLTSCIMIYPRNYSPLPPIMPAEISSFLRSPEGVFISGLVGLVIVSGLIAIIAPPNNWDSMTYHMSRVRHWIQQQSVAHYDTSELRQLFSNPWAEFAIAHMYILTGTDRLANCVQWFSMVGSLAAVSLLASSLGGGKGAAVLAAVVAGTIPMGILESSSTQNDYVTGFWLLCFSYFLLRIKHSSSMGRPTWMCIIYLGLSLGLAILTKGTAYVFALPFLCWFTWFVVRRLSWRALPILGVVGGLVITLNIGHALRNWSVFHAIEGPEEIESWFVNETFTDPVLFLSNAARNLAIEISTFDANVNYYLWAVVYKGVRLLGGETSDPRSTWPGMAFHLSTRQRHEDFAGSPLHLLLTLTACAALVVNKRFRTQNSAWHYALAVIAGAAIFCLCIKWQVWHNRLLLPLLLLSAPLVASIFSQLLPERFNLGIAVILIISSVPALLANETRPIIGEDSILTTTREHQYFANRKGLGLGYQQAAGLALNGECAEIGLRTRQDDYEYPLWVLLDRTGRLYRMRHLGVTNVSSGVLHTRGLEQSLPCTIIVTNRLERPEVFIFDGHIFPLRLKSDAVNVYGAPTQSD